MINSVNSSRFYKKIILRLFRDGFEVLVDFLCLYNSVYNDWKIPNIDDLEWDCAFEGEYEGGALQFEDVIFIPNSTLKPKITDLNGDTCTYYLTQNGIRIEEIPLQSNEKILDLKVLKRGKLHRVHTYILCTYFFFNLLIYH